MDPAPTIGRERVRIGSTKELEVSAIGTAMQDTSGAGAGAGEHAGKRVLVPAEDVAAAEAHVQTQNQQNLKEQQTTAKTATAQTGE